MKTRQQGGKLDTINIDWSKVLGSGIKIGDRTDTTSVHAMDMSYYYPKASKDRIDFPGVKYANPYTVPEYNQPKDERRILLDPRRPKLVGTNATEYKIGIGIDGKEIQIPRVVGGQLLSDDGAVTRYMLTGESFGTMNNPSAYSRFYDKLQSLGILQNK